MASPEISADPSRDYSVYVMDPLEESYAHGATAKQPQPGVAVGMGLLRWRLGEPESEEPISATGRIRPDKQAGEAVEVVIALQEVRCATGVYLRLTRGRHGHSRTSSTCTR